MPACPACDAHLHDTSLRFCGQCGHDLNPKSAPKSADDEFDGLVGKTVDGRYKVLGRIGVGGMGVVYRVEHVRMGKVAAMKVLRRDMADDAQAAKRFVREVEVVSKLDHPNIVQTFDFGEWHGLLYLVMELVRGEDLAAVVRRDGPLSISRTLPLFIQVCLALDEAHHAGVIHRDLKPDNIVVFRRREGEHVKVLDFGLAKLREKAGLVEVTGAGSLVGTPYYMAPEQVRSEAVDERTDIYALGATIYRVVTGMPAFAGDSPMSILTRHVTEPLVPPSHRREGLPLDLDHLLLKAMAKDPANRFQTAVEMREAMESILAVRVANHEQSQPLPEWVEKPNSAASSTAASRSAVTRVEVPSTTESTTEDSEALSRLRREDVDRFERRLTWRRRLLTVGAPFALAGLVWGGWQLLQRFGEEPGITEVEINDTASTANSLPNGASVFGQVGDVNDDGTPDFDYFRVPGGQTPRTLQASVTGVPDMNLVLELFDVTGALIVKIDGGLEGSGEALGPWKLGRNEAFLRVRPLWVEAEGGRPPASSQTPYALTATWGNPDLGWELEPNDVQSQANPLLLDPPLQGHIATPKDLDWFVVTGEPGTSVRITVDAESGQEFVLESSVLKRRLLTTANLQTDPIALPPQGRFWISLQESTKKKGLVPDRTKPYKLTLVRVP